MYTYSHTLTHLKLTKHNASLLCIVKRNELQIDHVLGVKVYTRRTVCVYKQHTSHIRTNLVKFFFFQKQKNYPQFF